MSWGQAGPKILFVHGWAGRGSQIAGLVEPLVNRGYQVISFDFPAHGESGGKTTQIFELADTLSQILDQLGPFYGVITHSLGGMVLGQVCPQAAGVERVVMFAPPAKLESAVDNFQILLHVPDKVMVRFWTMLRDRLG